MAPSRSTPQMMQVTRAAFQAVASLNKQATDPKSHTLVKKPLQDSFRSCYLLNSDGRPLKSPFALWIALKLTRFDRSVSTASTSMNVDQVQNVAFTVLGFYYLFRAVTGTVYWLVFFGGVRATPYVISFKEW